MIGRLRHAVSIQAPARGQDGFGQAAGGWVTVAAGVPAEVLGQGGGEPVRAGQQQSSRGYRVTMRAWPGLDERHRLLWGTRALNVESVTDVDGRGVWLELACREGGG